MKQHKEPDIQLEQWNPPVKEWGPVYKAIFRAFSMIWRAGKVETVVLFFLMLVQGVLPVFILSLPTFQNAYTRRDNVVNLPPLLDSPYGR